MVAGRALGRQGHRATGREQAIWLVMGRDGSKVVCVYLQSPVVFCQIWVWSRGCLRGETGRNAFSKAQADSRAGLFPPDLH